MSENNDRKQQRDNIRKQWKADEVDVSQKHLENLSKKNKRDAERLANNSEPDFPQENDDGTINKG